MIPEIKQTLSVQLQKSHKQKLDNWMKSHKTTSENICGRTTDGLVDLVNNP